MQNGVVGVLCECSHTSVIHIIPSQALTLPAICFPCRLLRLGFSAQQSGANRNRGRFWLWFGGAESTGHFRGQACGYSRMRGSLIKEQGRGYVMYYGPDQAMASEDAVACIKNPCPQGLSHSLTFRTVTFMTVFHLSHTVHTYQIASTQLQGPTAAACRRA